MRHPLPAEHAAEPEVREGAELGGLCDMARLAAVHSDEEFVGVFFKLLWIRFIPIREKT